MTFSSPVATAEFSKYAHLDKHDGLITHLEPDIWSVKSNKASRGEGIPAEPFQVPKISVYPNYSKGTEKIFNKC